MTQVENLKSAPLKEVIFEINWLGEVDDYGVRSDSGFALAQGKFFILIKEKFPIHKKLYTTSPPEEFGTAIHQYWSGELEWPLIQHGQGMMTINQTEENYTWASFRSLIFEVIDCLKESYENELEFSKVNLQYFDAFDLKNMDFLSFVGQNLQTEIKASYNIPGRLKNISIDRNYLQDDGSELNIAISSAINNETNEEAVLMIISIEKQDTDIKDYLDIHIDRLHTICSDSFRSILNKKYYESLNQ